MADLRSALDPRRDSASAAQRKRQVDRQAVDSPRPQTPDPRGLTPADVLSLQRTIGNQAVVRLLQAKQTVGPSDDPSETEADRIAEIVALPSAPEVQRQEDYGQHGDDSGEAEAQEKSPSAGAIRGPVGGTVVDTVAALRRKGDAPPKPDTMKEKPPEPKEEDTDFGKFTVYPDDTKKLPVADRKVQPWPIKQKDLTDLKAKIASVKAGTSGIKIGGDNAFQTAVQFDLAWLMTQSVGRELLQAIMDSGKKLTIEKSTGGNDEQAANFDDGLLRENGTKGPGSDATVNYNTTEWDPYGGGKKWQKRPPAIGLAHEMIHAWADMSGISERPGTGAVPGYEKQTVGLPGVKQAKFTENKFRAAFGLPRRPEY